MHARVLAVIIPTAILVVACAGGDPAPTWTDAPSASAAAVALPTEPRAPVATVPAAPSVPVAATPLTGEVEVVMSDAMRFAPDPITVKAGEEITFVVTNEGTIVHEFVVGTEDEQVEHAAEMAQGGMSHGHGNALSLDAGETGSLTMTFAEANSLIIGCHEPGHYEAGMKVALTVVD